MSAATPDEVQRGRALADSMDYLLRASAALRAAIEGEPDVYRRGAFREVLEQLHGSLRALRLLS